MSSATSRIVLWCGDGAVMASVGEEGGGDGDGPQ